MATRAKSYITDAMLDRFSKHVLKCGADGLHAKVMNTRAVTAWLEDEGYESKFGILDLAKAFAQSVDDSVRGKDPKQSVPEHYSWLVLQLLELVNRQLRDRTTTCDAVRDLLYSMGDDIEKIANPEKE
jgi:hypothetical protein